MRAFTVFLTFVCLASASAAAQADEVDFSVASLRTKTTIWDQADWSLTTTQYAPGYYQGRLAMANGYVGASVAMAGPFWEQTVGETEGWPLFSPRVAFASISGFWDVQEKAPGTNYPWLSQYGYDSFVSGIPHPTAITFAFLDAQLNATVDAKEISDFRQTLRMRTGEVEWSYTWKPAGLDTSFNVTYAAFFSRVRPNVVAVQATITPSRDVSGSVTDLLDGRSALRSRLSDKAANGSDSTIYAAVHPDGLDHVTGFIFSTADFPGTYAGPAKVDNETSIGQTFSITLQAGETATFHKYVGVASTDKFPQPRAVAKAEAARARNDGWDALLAEHKAAWQALMTDQAVDNFTDPATGLLPDDENVQVLQVASVANTYYLLQNLLPDDDGSGLNDNSVSVGGLASESYGGLIFWDADLWMAPGLNLNFPDYARQVANYRVKQHPQALANAAANEYPAGSSLYSWTSGRYGNCTATGPCVDYQYHLNYDIAFNMLQLRNVTADETWFADGPMDVVLSTAAMTANLLQYNETTDTYEIYNATDPDEYANNVNNPSFTLASAATLLDRANELLVSLGQPANETWARMASHLVVPRAPGSNITLEYQGMNNSAAIKQADVVLLGFPLGYQGNGYSDDDDVLRDLDYYATRQSPDGPAMTFGAYAVAANAVSQSGCAAYTYTLKSFLPYLRAPWFQFSEQEFDDPEINGGTRPAFPFLTGHGGANQVVPYGFLGLRTDRDSLLVDPSLPPQVPHLRVRRFFFAGAAFTADLNATHTVLTRVPADRGVKDSYDSPVDVLVGSSRDPDRQIRHSLSVNQAVTLVNRQYWRTATHAQGNLLQCAPVHTSDGHLPGQLPEALVDGSTATAWQPTRHDASAAVVVDMRPGNAQNGGYRPLTGLHFDFGARPPSQVQVWLWNSTQPAGGGLGGLVTGCEEGPTVELERPLVMVLGEIEPSLGPQDSTLVVPVVHNMTDIDLSRTGAWSADWVKLVVTGCAECGDEGRTAVNGATINEFVVF